MQFTALLTDLATAIVSLLEILLPGVVGSVVDMFDALAFTTTGDTTTMSAAFGWIVLASVLSAGIWVVRLLVGKIFGGSKTHI